MLTIMLGKIIISISFVIVIITNINIIITNNTIININELGFCKKQPNPDKPFFLWDI